MFTNLAERIIKPQGDSFHAAWRDPSKSVTPAKVNTSKSPTSQPNTSASSSVTAGKDT